MFAASARRGAFLDKEAAMPVWTVDIDRVRLDERAQPRVSVSSKLIEDYAEAMRDGATFPPIVVFDDGETLWVADGFHRTRAAILVGAETIEVDVRKGGLRDAKEYALGANAAHGDRRTRADVQRSIEIALRDEEWVKRSNQWLAKMVGVADTTIATHRERLEAGSVIPTLTELLGEDGKVYPRRAEKPKGTSRKAKAPSGNDEDLADGAPEPEPETKPEGEPESKPGTEPEGGATDGEAAGDSEGADDEAAGDKADSDFPWSIHFDECRTRLKSIVAHLEAAKREWKAAREWIGGINARKGPSPLHNRDYNHIHGVMFSNHGPDV
ncbi:MAG: ParB/RepB/Spo0J family partition protein, partial [Verrucomicrobiota bacterium]